jgi:hypothetical protein
MIYHSQHRLELATTEFIQRLGANTHWERLKELKHFIRMFITVLHVLCAKRQLDIEKVKARPYFEFQVGRK